MNLLGRRFVVALSFFSPSQSQSLSPTTQRAMSSTTTANDASGPKKFWDKMAEGYYKSPISDEEAYQKKIQITQSYLRPDMEVLEYGCGTGGTSIIHAPFVKHILATDISSNMIDIAKKQAEEKKVSNVDFKCASIDELALSVPNNSLDAVLGLSILHLVENRREVMKRTYNWLKPGGLFVTSTVCINDMRVAPLMKLIFPIGKFFGLIPPVFALSRDELVKDFEDAGFDIEHEWRPENKKTGKPRKDAAVFIIGKKPQ
mmetsp:Transcript_2926/g.6775  ORF Transcript_2926/g.6775 Transcript_2926/m.6775 type:complete len:259 (+) Transcript_2926:226-1002(+)